MNELLHELQLKTERLENEINFKNGLISLLSHNSKELLGNFIWIAEAAEQKTISEENFFKLLPEIKRGAQQNLQTIQDSTAWLKTQYGNFEIKPEKILVADVFQRLEEKFTKALKEKNLTLHFDGDNTGVIETDRLLLDYVLDKILENAIKYSFPGQAIHCIYFKENKRDILSVTDVGTGMEEKYLSSVFTYGNPVFTGTAGEKGAGLSLKIVKNFVTLLHGDLQIISKVNEGTTVSIFLPETKE